MYLNSTHSFTPFDFLFPPRDAHIDHLMFGGCRLGKLTKTTIPISSLFTYNLFTRRLLSSLSFSSRRSFSIRSYSLDSSCVLIWIVELLHCPANCGRDKSNKYDLSVYTRYKTAYNGCI